MIPSATYETVWRGLRLSGEGEAYRRGYGTCPPSGGVPEGVDEWEVARPRDLWMELAEAAHEHGGIRQRDLRILHATGGLTPRLRRWIELRWGDQMEEALAEDGEEYRDEPDCDHLEDD